MTSSLLLCRLPTALGIRTPFRMFSFSSSCGLSQARSLLAASFGAGSALGHAPRPLL